MQQFDLSLWLKNKSRKVVTRTGEPVEIVLTNWGDPFTILGRIGNSRNPIIWLSDGRSDMDAKLHDYDLFFADEEDELTEFEDKLLGFALMFDANIEEERIEYVKECAEHLLDLARKELQPEFDKEMDKMLVETDKVVYQKGQQDALKSLPKWKKNTLPIPYKECVMVLNGGYFCYKGYCIDYRKLFETLPKEE